ncbi:hypothetical protein JZ751_027515 [Albula glossodonta]|uniref:Uncharacterized protein n=1 Tax=Albula glossodonta TaxID=121402 RepID=A0A8T2NBL7_9TELE|nr:hypothetical protein JZ751_027515 [Albula glossodonta]
MPASLPCPLPPLYSKPPGSWLTQQLRQYVTQETLDSTASQLGDLIPVALPLTPPTAVHCNAAGLEELQQPCLPAEQL